MAGVNRYVVRAVRWEHGWELHIDGVGVTQSHGLRDAKRMVRDYLRLDVGTRAVRDAITVITPDIGDLSEDASEVRARSAQARVALLSHPSFVTLDTSAAVELAAWVRRTWLSRGLWSISARIRRVQSGRKPTNGFTRSPRPPRGDCFEDE
jgi:hypothetical protein